MEFLFFSARMSERYVMLAQGHVLAQHFLGVNHSFSRSARKFAPVFHPILLIFGAHILTRSGPGRVQLEPLKPSTEVIANLRYPAKNDKFFVGS